MIVIIADDITGAAEIAGISLRYFNNVKLYDNFVPKITDADIVVVCTNSRSMSLQKALQTTDTILRKIKLLHPIFVYKKIDSVLRGYVLQELKVQMKLQNQKTALIAPANPSLKRVIKNGNYYINGKLISKTSFNSDPEFPIKSDNVLQILQNKNIIVVKENVQIQDNKIHFLEVQNKKQITNFVKELPIAIALAGAADFYTELISLYAIEKSKKNYTVKNKMLYISGTTSFVLKEFIKKASIYSKNVIYIDNKSNLSYSRNINTIIAYDQPTANAKSLRNTMANYVNNYLQKKQCKQILIEGGATTASIFSKLKIKEFSVVGELERGVVVLKTKNFYFILKPGSYTLPKEIEKIFLTN